MSKPGGMQRYYSGNYSQLVGNTAAFYASNQELEDYDEQARKSYAFPRTPSPVKAEHDDPFDSSYEAFRGQGLSAPLTSKNLDSYDQIAGHPRSRKRHEPRSRRRKCIVCGIVSLVVVIIIAVAIGVGVAVSQNQPYDYTPSDAAVTNQSAFWYGGATNNDPYSTNNEAAIGTGKDTYTYYSGPAANFPNASKWISFTEMWAGNLHMLQTSCRTLGVGKDNSASDNRDILEAIQNRAAASLVDHRFIFAVVLQESSGCVRVGSTTSSGGVTNPGMMQSHNGHSYSASHAKTSIMAMVQDGTQGTAYGDGLVQNLNNYGDPYSAARGYNSGYIPKSGNLSEAAGATACYVSDIANRLTGWVNATSICPGASS